MKSGFVALAGRPNAGKSTLINALVREKIAIVSPKAQTTRSEIRGIVNTETAQIVFTDTPGIHKPKHRLETRMNKEAGNVIQGVNLIYLVADGTEKYGPGDEYVLRMVKNAGVPVFLIFNKVDRMKKQDILDNLTTWQQKYDFDEFFPISALKQTDFHDLIGTTEKYLPEGEPMFPMDEVTDEPLNFQIAEIIREKILICTEQEVPHATGVLIESRKMENGICHINALVVVEKEGQKGILIGKNGSMLSKINTLASADIAALLDCKVRLSIFIRVEEEWRDKDARINALGYGNIDE